MIPCYISPDHLGRGQFNSSPQSTAYMCQWTRSALVQVMACKPLPEPMLTYSKYNTFHSCKCMWKCGLRNGGHFVRGGGGGGGGGGLRGGGYSTNNKTMVSAARTFVETQATLTRNLFQQFQTAGGSSCICIEVTSVYTDVFGSVYIHETMHIHIGHFLLVHINRCVETSLWKLSYSWAEYY